MPPLSFQYGHQRPQEEGKQGEFLRWKRERIRLWEGDGMVAGVFHKSVIKEACLMIPGVSWGLGDAAVMAEGDSGPLTTELCMGVRHESD